MKLSILNFISFNLIRYKFSPVILYHSVFDKIPLDLEKDLLNINPYDLEKQLFFLNKNYKIVTIDEYLKAKNKKGLASVTFDDGYKNIIKNALPIVKSLNIPITIFLITSILENQKNIFWRDKIRFIINNNLTEEAQNFFKTKYLYFENFYRDTKNFQHNSIKISNLIDDFFKIKKINFEKNNYQLASQDLIDDPLVSYGSHSHNHYVLSSLDYDQQYEEILKSKKIIDQLNLNVSNVFSIPFGSRLDFNEDTVNIVHDLKFDGLIMLMVT